ncbi:thymidylate kinase [Orenia metallireducens]|jgi:dTMP kinase|uniref:Thymidylate kinase n=1 Tax=Orenia metallireducens TaxID=1413210 RepID=A0A285H2D1_9FIRM|nr:dTMP kinase [Orenia metallireducens]PRX26442.1 thymidylate kinase [Orenia metallireducens]SNY28651.1 thymidylate kinase [Orenia metallireducens]
MKGYFITLEGVEGSGKSTQVRLIKEYLEGLGYKVLTTFEPGDTEVGKEIRRILLSPDNTELVSRAELLLYVAERAQHVFELVKPSLAKGKIVISDRYTDATLAYQGYARGLNQKLIEELNVIATEGLEPDLTLLLDIDPQISLQRAKQVTAQNHYKGDRIEAEKISFHQRVREGYLDLANKKERIELIDAKQSIEDIFNSIKIILQKRLIRDEN